MVLFKRKPVQFLPAPELEDDQQEVWHIPQTGEVFTSYDDYLNRMDFYKQKRFICTISGHSGLSFFEALKSETAGAAEVEQAFPEALKGPILRRVQFQTVSRIDALVDQIYDEFKNDFYPGETVTVRVIGGERCSGVVRDKVRMGPKIVDGETLQKPFSRYFVSLDERPDQEVLVEHDDLIFRDRKVFTKSVLRSFIKKTVTREAWNGAPWLVRPDVAEKYQIDTRIPPHLLHENKLLERKQSQAQKRMSHPDIANLSGQYSPTGPVRLPELKPAPKSHKSKAHQAMQAAKRQNGSLGADAGEFVHLPLPNNPFQFPYRNQISPPAFSQPEVPPPPPPPKYPIEDLQLEMRGRVRPPLQFFCSDPPVQVETQSDPLAPFGDKILMKSVGPLLETWDTLNVYCEIFKLDSFTFDDFIEAMHIASEEVPVQLFDEIHCAVLKILVSSESEGGKVQIQLPELEDEEDDEEMEDVSALPSPEPEPQPKGRATRSSLAKMEAERMAAEAAAAEVEMKEAENAPKHHAEEVLNGYDWIDHLKKRDFKDGGWEMIMVGLLYQLSKSERLRASCEELLQWLVPTDIETPSQETVRQRYASMDINHRAQALQIICMLTAETKAIRGYMEDCSETMTGYRKEKIEWQRKRKQAIEDLKSLNDQRKILLPDNMPPSPPLEPVKTNGEVKMSDVEDLTAHHTSDDDAESEDVIPGGRKLRRGQDRAAERKRKAEQEQERKEKAEAAKVPKQSKQFLKVLKDIKKKEDEITECEREIAVIDNDLREADCPRTRVLGKDRFWNRYYWFERNGMPYGGLPNSSTAEAGYANGCIWVQGPDDLEREGYIDMRSEWQDEYVAKFNITVPDRKKREEGSTSIYNACQWGYYSDPESVNALLDWLDPRGFNELKLRKELVNYREKIMTNMKNRKQYLGQKNETPSPTESAKKDVGAGSVGSVGNKRMSTRGNRTAATTPEPPSYRCLNWQNTMALDEIGHLHRDEPPPVRSRKQTTKKKETAIAEPEPAVTRGKKARQSRG